MIDELTKEGWRYIDPPCKFSPDMWNLFLDIIGEGNYEILTLSESSVLGKEWKRGQLMVSPSGIVNLQSHSIKKEKDGIFI